MTVIEFVVAVAWMAWAASGARGGVGSVRGIRRGLGEVVWSGRDLFHKAWK